MKQYTWHDTALYSRYNDKLKIQFFNGIQYATGDLNLCDA